MRLELRYKNQNPKSIALRECIIDMCKKYVDNGLGDKNAEQKLCSKDDTQYWQQLSEVLLADQLAKAQIQVAHHPAGPDFLMEHNGRKVWVEVTCPEPKVLPNEWINHIPGTVASVPHEEILLRWTNPFKTKVDVLIGNPDKNIIGYLEKGIVCDKDAYVIAINGRLLRGFGGVFPELNGISQFPFAGRATKANGGCAQSKCCKSDSYEFFARARGVHSNRSWQPLST